MSMVPNVQTDTEYLYASIPEYIQDWDAQNGYQLLLWLDGACSMLEVTDSLARDGDAGVGWSLLFNYGYYYNLLQGFSITAGTYSGGVGTFTANHCFEVGDTVFVGPSASNASFEGEWMVLSVTNALPTTTDFSPPYTAFTASPVTAGLTPSGNCSGSYCTPYPDIAEASDLYRALVALPWLAQFVGLDLPQIPYTVLNPSVNYQSTGALITAFWPYIQNWIQDITSANSFQRGTKNQFINILDTFLEGLVNPSQPNTQVPTSNFIVLEKTNVIYTTHPVYIYDPYSVVVLIPSQFIPVNSYLSVYGCTPTGQPYSYYSSEYTDYNNIPNDSAVINAFLDANVPAGLNVTLLYF